MNIKSTCIMSVLGLSLLSSAHASDFELTPWIGMTFSSDINSALDNENLNMSDDANLGLSFAWQDSPNGQGMLLINRVSHEFTSDVDNQKHELDIVYLHFNGVAQFRQQSYVTTVSIGLGGAFATSDSANEIYPSFTSAIGTRYEYTKQLALVTEARVYASLVEQDDQLFCKNEQCFGQFTDAVWLDTSVSIGIAYKF
jgi:hypothetical protein